MNPFNQAFWNREKQIIVSEITKEKIKKMRKKLRREQLTKTRKEKLLKIEERINEGDRKK